ncbi:cytochrome c [Litoreibacter halocynthiae]|uniref:Cytochrome c n=1 Tax=Litoreibacter halocynthiae TaxID=1242689 RepID=A0A4R7LS08_9RHOB|nr:c-type cytochrome [Litoreibacter halocynthiae]TDT77291.1 cytochrome c [Litoreibacter halocynthiae]
MIRSIALAVAILAPLTAAAQDVEAGGDLFMQYCATCHGVDAKGGGPMNSVLVIQPTDLTRLASENDGVFPRVRAISRIDGRDPLVSHGSPMPVFGQFFEGRGETIRGEDGVMIMTSQPVIDLVGYLEGVQE